MNVIAYDAALLDAKGKADTAIPGLNPGDGFEIRLGKMAIRLVPIGGSDEAEAAAEADAT